MTGYPIGWGDTEVDDGRGRHARTRECNGATGWLVEPIHDCDFLRDAEAMYMVAYGYQEGWAKVPWCSLLLVWTDAGYLVCLRSLGPFLTVTDPATVTALLADIDHAARGGWDLLANV